MVSYCRWLVAVRKNTWNTKCPLPFYITISKKCVFLITINYCVLSSITFITILLSYCVSSVDGLFWWARASGIQKVSIVIKQTLGELCFLLWIILGFEICLTLLIVCILRLFNPLLLPIRAYKLSMFMPYLGVKNQQLFKIYLNYP